MVHSFPKCLSKVCVSIIWVVCDWGSFFKKQAKASRHAYAIRVIPWLPNQKACYHISMLQEVAYCMCTLPPPHRVLYVYPPSSSQSVVCVPSLLLTECCMCTLPRPHRLLYVYPPSSCSPQALTTTLRSDTLGCVSKCQWRTCWEASAWPRDVTHKSCRSLNTYSLIYGLFYISALGNIGGSELHDIIVYKRHANIQPRWPS